MDDLISRQAAIDALGEEPVVWMEKEDEYGQGLNNQWRYDVNALKAVPSAQPDPGCVLTVWGDCSYAETGCSDCEIKAKITKTLELFGNPEQSAQPKPLTDKEQRIFLAAMGREEKVCKQVDEECRDCCEPYEDSLVSVCREITRKVKGVLWT